MKNLKIERCIAIKGYPTQKKETMHLGLDERECEFYMDCCREVGKSMGRRVVEDELYYIEFETENAYISYEVIKM